MKYERNGTVISQQSVCTFFLANILERLGSMIAGISLMFYLLDQYGKQPVYATMTQIMIALPALIFFY